MFHVPHAPNILLGRDETDQRCLLATKEAAAADDTAMPQGKKKVEENRTFTLLLALCSGTEIEAKSMAMVVVLLIRRIAQYTGRSDAMHKRCRVKYAGQVCQAARGLGQPPRHSPFSSNTQDKQTESHYVWIWFDALRDQLSRPR
jgi:hypothetical protein